MKLKLKVFPLDYSPGYIIFRSATRMKAELLRAFRKNGFDVTPEQWSVLNKLWEIEGLNQIELAEKTSKDRHTITRILNLMEEKKLIIRKLDPEDNRCFSVYLTPEGKDLKNRLIPVVIKHLERTFAGFKNKDLEDLRRMHERINKNLGKTQVMKAKSGGAVKLLCSKIPSGQITK